jgi:RNA polymerase sigma-70 factor (ECF subfamily)
MQAQPSHIGNEQNPVVQIRRRNTGELQEIVSRHLPMLYRRAFRYVGDSHEAEDVVQDALLSAYRHLDQFQGTAKMTTWLTTIVTNSALTRLRKRPRHDHISLDERLGEDQDYCVSDGLADARPSPESECIRSERHDQLIQYVKQLSPSFRKAIQLCDLDGLTTKEVADILGVPHSTMKSRVSRARWKLKQLMHSKQKGKDIAGQLCTK